MNENRKLTLKLGAFALGSFAFGFALIPLYAFMCEITGTGNQKSLTEQRLSVENPDDTRTITIDFMADLPSVGNWEFRPTVASMQIHPGRLYKTEFFARNLTGHATTAQASPNIMPGQAVAYFGKTECFCFVPQHFAVNDRRYYPLFEEINALGAAVMIDVGTTGMGAGMPGGHGARRPARAPRR